MLCIEACASGLLKLSRKLNAQSQRFVEIEHEEKCAGCRQCAQMCPEAAIEIDRCSTPKARDPRAAVPVGAGVSGEDT